MNNTHLLVVMVLLWGNLSAQQIHFVAENGTGTGSSWHDASSNLNHILNHAKPGDQVWVAKGTYTPTTGNDRTASFEIPAGIQLLGGFAGNESNALQRKPTANKTVLSGEIGEPGLSDNSYNVIFTHNVSATTIIDGFIITRGNADGIGPTGDRQRCGGGWYNDGSNGTSNPNIRNCTFTDNYARDGAAMYNNGRFGEASPAFVNCIFNSNKADLDGGALYNDGRDNGKSNPELTFCTIENNFANYGAGLFNYGGGGMSSPILKDCFIVRNLAYVRGGAMLNMDVNGKSYPILETCSIEENEASVGEGIYQFSAVNGTGIKTLFPHGNR